jgi:MFS family permease
MGIITVGLFVVTTLADTTRLSLLLTLLALLGFGFALFSSPNTNAVMGAVEPRVYGIASGILGTMRLLGQMLSMAVVLLLFSLIMGDAQLTPELSSLFLKSTRVAFGVSAVLCAAGVVASLKRGNVR